ncbi:hypothetical protein DSECCO2_535980 [anaerobic digester metagenome]
MLRHLGVDDQNLHFLVNGVPRAKIYRLKNNDAIISSTAPAVDEPDEQQAEMPVQPGAPMPQPAAAVAAAGSPLAVATVQAAPQAVAVAAAGVPEATPAPSTAPQPLPMPVVPALEVTVNGIKRMLPPKPDGGVYQFLDMLNLVDIDPTKPQGDIVLLHNGRSASYIEPVLHGDKIDIYWAKRSH